MATQARPNRAYHNSQGSNGGASFTAPPVPTKETGGDQPLRHESYDMPQFGATFVPGGIDDYAMPEVIAPSPQRVMPEVPQNMQEDLQRMEHSAARRAGPTRNNNSSNNSNNTSPEFNSRNHHSREPSLSTFLSGGTAADNRSAPRQTTPEYMPFKDMAADNVLDMSADFDLPSFSPFPKVTGDNVPPSDEDKEEILYNAQTHVLHSNNVSMQLSWARDALSWVETSFDAHMRENHGKVVRPRTPKVEHDLRENALSIVGYLAEQGHPEALFMRSKWQEFGKFGLRMDKKAAYGGYKKAAEQGWSRAQYRMGMLFESSNDMQKAIKHYNLGRDMGDSAASYRLGMLHMLGQHGYEKDYRRGLDLIQSAADNADEDAPQGAYVYGMLIARELPDMIVPEGLLAFDLKVARQYCMKAAYLGFAKAQVKMGQACELCQLECEFNPALSLHYYGLAARQGQSEAALGVSRWFLFGHEGSFSKNEQLAFSYAKQAADANLPTGEFAMGYYHEIGIHVQKNLREARNWYEKAAEHGNQEASARLESLNEDKTLSRQDHETTALTRIKSQHGSQRGKRPERFKQKDPGLPTLNESDSNTPVGGPGPKGYPFNMSPRRDMFDMPDPSRLSISNQTNSRPPAFTVNLDQGPAARVRPQSAMPYPDDDRPPPLRNNRPKSTAPYPDDDMTRGPYMTNPLAGGPHSDKPGSAFGIRNLSPNSRPGSSQGPQGRLPASRSAGSLPPVSSANMQSARGRIASAGWESQPFAAANTGRRPMPGGAVPDYPSSPAWGQDPSRNRLAKPNPNVPQSQSRPALHANTSASGRFDRVDSMPVNGPGARLPTGPRPGGRLGPGQADPAAGRASAPPAQATRPGLLQQQSGGRQPSQGTNASAPAKPQSQGPATFEEMGLHQGKDDANCIVM